MTAVDPATAIEVSGLVKNYQGLRPLRVRHLSVRGGERIAISGLDLTAAEVLTNLLNGGILADAGEVRVFGRLTSDIASEDEWLASLEQFGIVSPRGVLLEGATVVQNLALPFTIEIDEIPETLGSRIESLASSVGLGPDTLPRPVGDEPADVRMRVHLARALALGPRVLLMEHPTLSMPRDRVASFAETVRDVSRARSLTLLALTGDDQFADIVAERSYRLHGGTGALTNARGWRRWFQPVPATGSA